jgi:hypothetical protein
MNNNKLYTKEEVKSVCSIIVTGLAINKLVDAEEVIKYLDFMEEPLEEWLNNPENGTNQINKIYIENN